MDRKEVRDQSGNLLYWTEKQGDRIMVYKADGKVLGWCENGKTFDASGNLVSNGIAPGLLYNG